MNLGLALAKPAESDLGLAMRLWMVNRGAWKLVPQNWEERVSSLIAKDPKFKSFAIPRGKKGLNRIRELQAQLLSTNSAPVSLQMKRVCRTTGHRNCHKCATMGYHCAYFDYPWLECCPVHELPLLTCCPDCSLPWPMAMEVFRRDCSTCGIREPIEFYLKHGAFDVEPFTQQITPLQSLFSTPINLVHVDRRYLFGQRTDRNDRFAQTLSFPSVLATYKGAGNEQSRLSRLGLSIHDCYQRHIDVVELGDRPSYVIEETHVGLMTRCRLRVLRLGIRVLRAQAGHALGSCATDSLHRHYQCVYCESWRQWTRGFEPMVEEHPQQAMLTYHPPYTRRVSVPDPGLVTELYDHESGKRYQLPRRIQGLIYQLELWLCFRKLVAQIQYYLDQTVDVKLSVASRSEPERVFMSHHHHHFAYFYFVRSDNRFSLIFPKAYACTDLLSEEPQWSLFRELQ